MNDFELNGAEVNGSSSVYAGDGSASFYFQSDVKAQTAILASGSAQIIHQSSLLQQVRKPLSASIQLSSQTALLPQVRKGLEANAQAAIQAGGYIKRLAEITASSQLLFGVDGSAIVFGPPRAWIYLRFNAAAQIDVRKTVHAQANTRYIETRATIPEIKNRAIHLKERLHIEVFSNLYANGRIQLTGESLFSFCSSADARISDRPDISGLSEVEFVSVCDLSTIRYIHAEGVSKISLSCRWNLIGMPDGNFGFIKAKPDRIIMVPMDDRKLIIPLGVQ